MAPKFGNVLCVLACLLAVLVLALGATVFFLADPSSKAGQNPIAVLGASMVMAILIWGIGEGLRVCVSSLREHLHASSSSSLRNGLPLLNSASTM